MNGLGCLKLGQGRNSWQLAKHAWLHSDLLLFDRRPFLSSGFSTEGTLLSASAVPHCGRRMQVKRVGFALKDRAEECDWKMQVLDLKEYMAEECDLKV